MTGAAATTLGERASPAPAKAGTMRALTLVADRKIELLEVAAPPPPVAGEVQIGVKAIGLNHIDVWGWRGMAFAKRKLPLVVGVEAAGEIIANQGTADHKQFIRLDIEQVAAEIIDLL